MALEYLKKATLTATSDANDVHDLVAGILNDIEAGGDAKALEYAAKFDKYDGNVVLTPEEIEAACALVPEKLKRDIDFSHANVKKFAEAQKATLTDIEVEVVPGLHPRRHVVHAAQQHARRRFCHHRCRRRSRSVGGCRSACCTLCGQRPHPHARGGRGAVAG